MFKSTVTVAVALALGLAGCGDDDKPAETVTVTQTATAPAASVRKPVGHEELRLQGMVTDIKTVQTGDPDLAQYRTLLLTPESGGAPLRVGVAPDLDVNLDVRETLLDPPCEGKVLGAFKVAGAPNGRDFDWELLTAAVVRDDCR